MPLPADTFKVTSKVKEAMLAYLPPALLLMLLTLEMDHEAYTKTVIITKYQGNGLDRQLTE